MKRINDLIKTIVAFIENRDIAIVGIDGLGGSGKSTLAENVAEVLSYKGINNVVLHLDDFIFPRSVRYNDNYSQWLCYYNLQWRYDYLRNEIIHPLKTDGVIDRKIEIYDNDCDVYKTESLKISGKAIVIIEGVFLQREELTGVFDYVVYVDVPESIRLQRVLKRDKYIGSEKDITQKYVDRYFPAEQYYVDRYSPSVKADWVCDNSEQKGKQ